MERLRPALGPERRQQPAAGDTILLEVLSIAGLRSPAALVRIGQVFDEDPDFRLERLSPRDPPRTPVASAAEALGAWQPAARDLARGWYFFGNRRKQPRGRTTIEIDATMPGRVPLTSVRCAYAAGWFARPERVDQLVRHFGHLCEATNAFYGRAALGATYDQRNLLLTLARGLESSPWPDFERELPDVYWLNFFGPGYLDHWEAGLNDLGVRRDRVAGGVIVWAADRPPPVAEVGAITDYPFKQAFYAALGQDTFMSERQHRGLPGEHVPTYEAHRRHLPPDKRQ